ncbi:MAG: hypothetical protein MK554_09805, partial [Planctomycetes bacterium]|nr:hypothetical protein [Planctomycetota bacterium]
AKSDPGGGVRRGDADDSGTVNLTDGIFLLNWLFQAGGTPSCPDSADADDNGSINLTDAIYLLNFLFQGGPAPERPGIQDCGVDGVPADGLADCTYNSC